MNDREALHEARTAQGKHSGRDCDEYGCTRTVEDGVLWRVNPKGEPGIFMCREHRDAVDDWRNRALTPEAGS